MSKVGAGIEKYGEGVLLSEEDQKDFDLLVRAQRNGGSIDILPDPAEPEASPEPAPVVSEPFPVDDALAPPMPPQNPPPIVEPEAAVEPEPPAASPLPPAKPRGRPKGSKNKPKPSAVRPKKAIPPAKTRGVAGRAQRTGPMKKKAKVGRPPGAEKAYAEVLKFRRKHPQPLTDRGPGVVRTIVQALRKAGERGRPVTKAEIHERLKRQFPDRDPNKMMTTVNNRVPTYLNKIMGMGVVRDPATGGYYIPPQ